MMVVTVENWPGGEPARRRPQGWAAVLRVHRHGRHEWVVAVTLDGHRHSWTGSAAGGALGALFAALAAVGIGTPHGTGSVPSDTPAAELARVVQGMSGRVELHLAGGHPASAQTLGGGPVASNPAQRIGARQRVLALPMLTEAQVEALFDGERDHPAIVRGLRKAGAIIGLRHAGDRLFPVFQFSGARPHAIAVATNLTLRADCNPWRAAIWWNDPHPILGCRPLDLLHRPDEHDRLLTAARIHGGPHGC